MGNVEAGAGANPNGAVEAVGGASFNAPAPGATDYRLNQLAVTIGSDGSITPATGVNAAGATIRVDNQSITSSPTGATAGIYTASANTFSTMGSTGPNPVAAANAVAVNAVSSVRFTIHDPTVGIEDVLLTATSDDEFATTLPDGRVIEVVLDSEVLDGPEDDDSQTLSYMRFGDWAIYSPNGTMTAAAPLYSGYETPVANVPTTGIATYAADVEGKVSFLYGSTHRLGDVEGTAAITADFANNSVTGTFTEMEFSADLPAGIYSTGEWNDVAFAATLSGNGFAGSTEVTSNPGGVIPLDANAAGTVSGTFFGPNVEEIGGIWTLSDGTNTAVGTIAGMKQ